VFNSNNCFNAIQKYKRTAKNGGAMYCGRENLEGPRGFTGSTGATGMTGVTGPTGGTGSTGPTGGTGATGVGFNGVEPFDFERTPSYESDQVVTFQGSTYLINVDSPTGIPGSSPEYTLLAQRGETGATGVTGVTGAQGIQGVTGATGVTGAQGIQGVTGATGVTGAQGIQGVTGVTGVTGAQGIQGVTGATGVTGAQGIQGATGATGVAGAQGIQGVTGATGVTGAQGIQGVTGATGVTGAQGIQGVTGATGITGAQGNQGVTGVTGPSPLANYGVVFASVGGAGRGTVHPLTNASGAPSRVNLIGFGRTGNDITVPDGSSIPIPFGTDNNQFFFSFPQAVTLTGISANFNNYNAFTAAAGTDFRPFVALATSPQGTYNFSINTATLQLSSTGYAPGVSNPNTTILTGQSTGLNVLIPANTLLAIVGGIQNLTTGASAEIYIYMSGSFFFRI